jgi:oligoribonuclease NrnB/cAMP/cGMP phosphodiesterase (DHH superfamily)
VTDNKWRHRIVKSFRVSDELLEMIMDEAASRNTTLSAFIRYAVTKQIDFKRHWREQAA